MRLVLTLAFAAMTAFVPSAFAEVVNVSAVGFEVRHSAEVAAPPTRVWRDIGWIGRWWGNDHTYSGDARRMRLAPLAGGCWCESWGEGSSVEHARVILAVPNQTLRLRGGLGPLQEMGATGVLTFSLAEHGARTRLTLTYRVSGNGTPDLTASAPLVDQVLGEQFVRLKRFSESNAAE
jgi:uncharacterized protein YndB with AHSA1/START domain